jgi:hypothetical protein
MDALQKYEMIVDATADIRLGFCAGSAGVGRAFSRNAIAQDTAALASPRLF